MTSRDRPRSIDESFAALLSDAIMAASDQLGRPRVRIPLNLPSSWAQGRATFGGLQTGLAMAALASRVDPDRKPRSMQVSFVAPATGKVELELECLRRGGSATMVRATLRDGDAVAMTLDACFGAPRSSVIAVAGPPAPQLDGPEGLASLEFGEGATPGFIRHVELRWAQGGAPGAGLDEVASAAGWVRTREPFAARPSAYVPALIDAWPAPCLQSFRRPVPASSVSWSVDFVGIDSLDPSARSEDWWIYAAETTGAAGGWVHTNAKLWTAAGQLVATSRQTVALFA